MNFHIDLKALQKDSTDGLFADVVTLGARAIHTATDLLLDECGPDRPGADLQGFENFGEVDVCSGSNNGSQLERADIFKSNCIASIEADTDDKDPPKTTSNWQIRPKKN